MVWLWRESEGAWLRGLTGADGRYGDWLGSLCRMDLRMGGLGDRAIRFLTGQGDSGAYLGNSG